jgi:hypothetical protein
MLWPALYGVLTPVCLPVADGINILHSTSDILKIEGNRGELTITLQGDRDLPGEIVFEGLRVNQIRSATLSGESLNTVRDHKRIIVIYNHKHKEELTLVIQVMA